MSIFFLVLPVPIVEMHRNQFTYLKWEISYMLSSVTTKYSVTKGQSFHLFVSMWPDLMSSADVQFLGCVLLRLA